YFLHSTLTGRGRSVGAPTVFPSRSNAFLVPSGHSRVHMGSLSQTVNENANLVVASSHSLISCRPSYPIRCAVSFATRCASWQSTLAAAPHLRRAHQARVVHVVHFAASGRPLGMGRASGTFFGATRPGLLINDHF